MKEDIRWKQRFSNYKKALTQLKKFIDKGNLSELEKQGLVKAFEYTYELAWNTQRDYLLYQGKSGLIGSRDTFRESFKEGIIIDGEGWMDMIKSRNLTIHSYNEETAEEITEKVFKSYFQLFCDLEEYFNNKVDTA